MRRSPSQVKHLLGLGLLLLGMGSPALAVSPDLVISQVYGGGGNAGAPYNADFVELFNRGTSAVSLGGKSIQYASSTGTTWAKFDLPALSLPAGKYALFQISATGANGVALPTPDGTASPIAMAAGAGKVALVAGTTALSGSCPTGLIDFVGYGGANCSETAATSAPSATLSVLRTVWGLSPGLV